MNLRISKNSTKKSGLNVHVYREFAVSYTISIPGNVVEPVPPSRQQCINIECPEKVVELGKTRIQSLQDRIDIAFETLKNIYDESKLEKMSQNSSNSKQKPSQIKQIQYDLEEVANKIVSKEGTVNLKTIEQKIKYI